MEKRSESAVPKEPIKTVEEVREKTGPKDQRPDAIAPCRWRGPRFDALTNDVSTERKTEVKTRTKNPGENAKGEPRLEARSLGDFGRIPRSLFFFSETASGRVNDQPQKEKEHTTQKKNAASPEKVRRIQNQKRNQCSRQTRHAGDDGHRDCQSHGL